MSEGAESQNVVNFPPGTTVPSAAQREAERAARLRDPDHLARLNDGLAAWRALPLEEQRRITAERKAEKDRKRAEREAKAAAKLGRGAPAAASENGPPTERSQRTPTAPPVDSPIETPRRVVSGPPRGLLDLCSELRSLGDGTCFIQVTRLKPPVAWGVPCAGVQKPIWSPVDDAEFSSLYGGAEYTLRGYRLTENGRTQALTEPVAYKVAGPPNLDAALTEEDTMRPNQPHVPNGSPALRRPGLVTPHAAASEAEMYARGLQHEETMDERNERRRLERERRAQEADRERRDEGLNATRLIMESKDREAERLDAAHQRELSLARDRGSGMEDVAKLLEVLKPGDDTAALSRQHSAEIRQLSESQKAEVIRLSEQHREEMRRQAESHTESMRRLDDQVRADRERADGLVRETDRRSGEQIREAQRQADQRVTDAQNAARTAYDDLKTRSEERLRDQNEQWQRRFDDLKEAQAREIRTKESEITLMRTGLEGNMAVILAGKDTEIGRLKHEVKLAKDEATQNKDWVGKMKELGEQAEVLGYVKPEPGEGGGAEEDLKTTAIKAGLSTLQRLPEIIQSGAQAIAQIRNPGVPPEQARAQARAAAVRGSMRTVPRTHGMGPVPQLQPLAFATEDGGYVAPAGSQALHQPSLGPMVTATPTPVQPPPAVEATPAPQAIVPAEQQPPAAPAQEAPPSQAPLAPPAPTAAPPSANGIDPQVLQILEIFTPRLEAQFQERITPEAVSSQIIAENTPDVARAALSMLSINQLLSHIVQNPGAHPGLSSRNGQKFLRDVWRVTEEALAQ